METDLEEKVKLLEAKDMDNEKIFNNRQQPHTIENSEAEEFVIVKQSQQKEQQESIMINKEIVPEIENGKPNGHLANGDIPPSTERRSDEPSELSFERVPENPDERKKRECIETALGASDITLEQWQDFATSEYGLVNDDLRRRVWPLLVGIDPKSVEPAPTLSELKSHPEYNQVILDVNRSLKRFPPGIPYDQRIALQDQLTVLILRVIIKYPHLKYYQGYHDVAVTFLLVVGEEVAFHVMEILSTNHLVECMQETMEPTQRRLMFLYPIIRKENAALCDYIERSTVGTLFALPWYLTWFGHSLNSYRNVVRLYDYFLASPHLLPLYVTAAIVLYRDDEIFKEDCDMASLHCLLSHLPEDLPFEYLLEKSAELYAKHPPDVIELDVQILIEKEKIQREIDAKAAAKRRRQIQHNKNNKNSIIYKLLPQMLWNRRSMFVTTAFSIFVGICAYYYKTHFLTVTSGIS